MKLLDIVLLLLLALGAYRGFKRGLVVEFFSLGALVLAAMGSTRLLVVALGLCVKWYHGSSEALPYLVFVFLFLIILVTIKGIGQFLKALIKSTLLGSLDRLLGSMIGLLKWSVGVSAYLWLGELLQLRIPEAYTANTLLFPFIKSLAPQLFVWCTAWYSNIWG
ncbi:MAG: CvpA family protein [Bacteroidota bacterium]